MVDVEWSDYGLKRLFNPESWQFLPVEDQLKYYKARDLHKSKTFATSKKIWGSTKIRKRIFIAPAMKDSKDIDIKVLSSPLKPTMETQKISLPEKPRILSEQEEHELHQKELKLKMADYKNWLKTRMELRDGLETMGMGEKWLQGKPELTVLEQKVLDRIVQRRVQTVKQSINIQDNDSAIASLVVPSRSPQPDLVYDLPEAVNIITKHLAERRLRVIDLFKQVDKDKSWTITRPEFKNCIKEARIPISDNLLDELIDNLDKDANEEIDFREFVDGIKFFKLGKRKKAAISEGRVDQRFKDSTEAAFKRLDNPEKPSRVSSAVSDTSYYSMSSMSDASYLTVPVIDITERRELAPDDMIEKRKRERHSAKGRRHKRDVDKVRTGNRFVDSHSLKSTIGEDVGGEVDHFREARLKDYYKLCKLCKDKEIELTPNLLERALLYPGDKPHRRIRKRIAIPGPGLLSSHFANPPAPPENPDDDLDFEKVFYNDDGDPVMDIKHSFPKAADVKPDVEVQNLSTGKAFVRSKINSWLTFEDYVQLTSHLGKRYVKLRDTDQKSDPFWPGHLLDKMKLCMDDHSKHPTDSLYRTRQPQKLVYPGNHNHDRWWPISDSGYMMPGDIENRKCYNIDFK